MRLLISLTLLLMLSWNSHAQSTTEDSSVRKKVSFEDARQKLKGVSVVGYYNFSDRNTIKLGQDTEDVKSQGTFGFGAQYRYSLSQYMKNREPMSVIGGLVFESNREFKAINAQQFQTAAKPAFSMALVYANLDYLVNKQFSVFGGLNFPAPFESNFGEIQLAGRLGFQGGITMNVAKSFAADFSYRMVNITGDKGLNRIDVDGLLLKGRYIF